MGQDEIGTLLAVRKLRAELVDPKIAEHRGRVFKTTGDGLLVEFPSVVNAVACAVDIQRAMATRNADLPEDRLIQFRIGVNLGDVIVEGEDVLGDGVNVAARLEGIAPPGGVAVSAMVRDNIGNRLDLQFEDLGEQQLKNIDTPVRIFKVGANAAPMPQVKKVATDKPSIAVLPFDNLSGDPGQQYLPDGIAEDIITELSRFRNLAVTARHASFHFRGKGVSLSQVARELGVAYVLEGSLRKTGDHIRVTAQLIDAKTGNHIWAERYERQKGDIFSVQDEVVSAIVNTLEGRIVAASAASARRKPTASWSAYDCLLQGRELCNNSHEPEAIPHFARAVAIDPEFVLGHAWQALALAVAYMNSADQAFLTGAAAAARKALALDANDPTAHWAAAMAAMFDLRSVDAGRHFDRAIALNPVDTQIRADRAQWLRYCGRLEEALAAIDEALQQGPLVPSWFWCVRGEILFDMQKYGEALAALDNATEKKSQAMFYVAAAQAQLGEVSKAAETRQALMQQWPSARLGSLPFIIPSVREECIDRLLQSLRKAGLPE
jgi:adenylate cyclase